MVTLLAKQAINTERMPELLDGNSVNNVSVSTSWKNGEGKIVVDQDNSLWYKITDINIPLARFNNFFKKGFEKKLFKGDDKFRDCLKAISYGLLEVVTLLKEMMEMMH